MSKTILLLGSYNGQDSLGDKCLLRCVVDRVRRAFGEDARIITHVHNPAELQGPMRDLNIIARQGVQSYLWRWQDKVGKLIKDPQILRKSAAAQFFWFGRIIMACRPGGRVALRDIKEADAIVIYGGTNFSKQWWWLNTPPYILSCAWSKAPIFLAPQQYGPMETDQLISFKEQLLIRAKSILCRNPKDVELLGLNEKNVLVKDEVFSNTRVYPTTEYRSIAERAPVLLVNMRFSSDFLFNDDDEILDRFCLYVGEISRRMKLKIKLFCMSGWTFADDLAGRKALEKRLNNGERLDVLAYTDEFDVLREAANARACISMSFHGAILSMIAGCPSLPVTLGDYYDFKYISFADYNPDIPIPLISLANEPSENIIEALINYIEGFKFESIMRQRENSCALIDKSYGKFANYILSD